MIEELNGDFLQWLRGFYFVARTGSVRKAAEEMHRNPSTVSYQLRCLEEQLQTVLFDRHKKSLRITPEGKELFAWAISTFETLKNLRSSVGNARGELRGNVRMAATLPIASLAVGAIAKFTQTYPKVKLTIDRGISRSGHICGCARQSGGKRSGFRPFASDRQAGERETGDCA